MRGLTKAPGTRGPTSHEEHLVLPEPFVICFVEPICPAWEPDSRTTRPRNTGRENTTCQPSASSVLHGPAIAKYSRLPGNKNSASMRVSRRQMSPSGWAKQIVTFARDGTTTSEACQHRWSR